jgi:putative peptide zinc metalloprotease protein
VLAYVLPSVATASGAQATSPMTVPTTVPITVRVALEPEQAALLRSQSREVSVRLPHMDALPAQLLRDPNRDSTATVTQLPSAALGDRHGGDIVTVPTDTTGLTAARGVVLMDVQVANAPAALASQIGSRASVRFDQGSRPLAWTLAQRAQQAVLMHFSPAS